MKTVTAAALAALLTAALILSVQKAEAQDPDKYTCTAVSIPITWKKKVAESVNEQPLPPGFVPVGGGSGGSNYNGYGSVNPFVIACKQL